MELEAVQQEFHRKTHGLLGNEWEYYLPGHWVPHCTVADRVALADLGAAVGRARELVLPISGALSRMALVQFGHRRVEQWVVPLGSER